MDRRQVIAGAAATAFVATMPVVSAAAVEVADPRVERIKTLFGPLRWLRDREAERRRQDPVLAGRPQRHRVDVCDVA
jgi:hypothetical protein